MILLVTATEMEAAPLRPQIPGRVFDFLVSGVGMVETSARLAGRLCAAEGKVSLVINFGVAGAYIGSGAGMLDLCLAESEVLGDFGVCQEEKTVPFPADLGAGLQFPLEKSVLERAVGIFSRHGLPVKRGVFVTVNGVSATASRGAFLRKAWNGLCENMEGAAVVRVCAEFSVPCLEVRSVSNMVEDRNPASWQLAAASERCAEAVSLLVSGSSLLV